MRVLIINTFETKGGAAVAGKRLLLALQKNGFDVSLLVNEKKTDDNFVFSPFSTGLKKYISLLYFFLERLEIFVANRFSRKNLFAVSTASAGFDITDSEIVRQADIIHIHWINQGFLSLKSIKKLVETGKPIVWTMHDMWPVTGICHHSRECTNYSEKCGNCMFLQKPDKKDLSYKVFKKKKKYLKNKGIHFVACSEWLKKRAEISKIANGNFVTNIPNPIDTDLFCPGNKSEARKKFGLPEDKKLLLFGALIASDKRKGIDYLIEATKLLADLKNEVELVYCGEIKGELPSEFGLKAHSLGYVSNQADIVSMYQAVDCFVIPSLEENLPNMIMESMSCGVPCVGFNIGGIPEMIQHLETGYVAEYKSAADFSTGIRHILSNINDDKLKTANRKFVLNNYSETAVANKYFDIYKSCLKK